MKILVAGGAGYIGSITAAQLVNLGHEVTVLDNLSRGHREAVHPECTFLHGDIASDEDLRAAFNHSPDVVMHLAALIEVGESMKEPARFYNNNVVCSIKLLDAMVTHHVSKLVFSSSAAVYAESQTMPIREDFPLGPTNAYGDTKLAFEKALQWYANAYDLRYVSLRYFNAAGATEERGEDHQPETHLIPNALRAARGAQPHLLIYGDDYPTRDGTCIRDYIHVSDLADAHVLAAEKLMSGGSSAIYNLGSEHGFSVKEVTDTARQVTGQPLPVKIAPRRRGDSPILIASSERIKNDLGWKAKRFELKQIITDAWRWQCKYPNGYAGGRVSG